MAEIFNIKVSPDSYIGRGIQSEKRFRENMGDLKDYLRNQANLIKYLWQKSSEKKWMHSGALAIKHIAEIVNNDELNPKEKSLLLLSDGLLIVPEIVEKRDQVYPQIRNEARRVRKSIKETCRILNGISFYAKKILYSIFYEEKQTQSCINLISIHQDAPKEKCVSSDLFVNTVELDDETDEAEGSSESSKEKSQPKVDKQIYEEKLFSGRAGEMFTVKEVMQIVEGAERILVNPKSKYSSEFREFLENKQITFVTLNEWIRMKKLALEAIKIGLKTSLILKPESINDYYLKDQVRGKGYKERDALREFLRKNGISIEALDLWMKVYR